LQFGEVKLEVVYMDDDEFKRAVEERKSVSSGGRLPKLPKFEWQVRG
jgi:hypothetical protein